MSKIYVLRVNGKLLDQRMVMKHGVLFYCDDVHNAYQAKSYDAAVHRGNEIAKEHCVRVEIECYEGKIVYVPVPMDDMLVELLSSVVSIEMAKELVKNYRHLSEIGLKYKAMQHKQN